MSTSIPYSDSTPPKAVIAIQRGADQLRVFAFFETGTEPEEALDIAEIYTDFVFEVRTRQNPSSTLLLRFELDAGLEILNTNQLHLTIPKEYTADIEGGIYWFDLMAEKDGNVQALIQGRFEMNNNVTIFDQVS